MIDTGCIKDGSETIFKRLRRAQLAKEGIDMDDKRDKVMIAKEKQETKQLVKDCFKMAQRSLKEKEAAKTIRIRPRTKEHIQDKQPMSLSTL